MRTWLSWLLQLASLGLVRSQGLGQEGQTPSDCKKEPLETRQSGEQHFMFNCDLHAINDQTDFSAIPSTGTVLLAIRCAEATQQESQLFQRSFQHLGELETLSIEHCKLGRIPADSFQGLALLRNLSLVTHSHPSAPLYLAPSTLAPLSRLFTLDLSSNSLLSLPESELCQLPDLQYVNISSNQLQDLADLGLSSSTNCSLLLRSIDLSHNRVKRLNSDSLESALHLEALFLQHNQISQVHDGALRGLVSLKSLDLSSNQIATLPAALFEDTPQLEQLKLDNNHLSAISSGLFRPLVSLSILDLSRNQISDIVRLFNDLPALCWLKTSHTTKSRFLTFSSCQ